MECGILVAADIHVEHLLPWWWERYRSFNTLPVAFVDLGMSVGMRLWCEKRGSLHRFIEETPRLEIDQKWEGVLGKNSQKKRQAWFRKPAACSLTPFEKTLWLDLDCEVLSCIQDVFSYLEKDKQLAICFDIVNESETLKAFCNSGVFVFSKKNEIIELWKEHVKNYAASHLGDESILSLLIPQFQEKISLLPEVYNWRICRGFPLHAKVIHWKGDWGKRYIETYGGLKSSLQDFPAMTNLFTQGI